MAALVVVALFWGNCFSCPQMLLLTAAHDNAHECCKRKGPQAPTPAQVECQSAPMRNFVQADVPQVNADLAVIAMVQAADAVPPLADRAFLLDVPEPSPPDLEILNSSIRI
jgi:hypothetical protein